jgi:hypothetical protein
MVAICDDELLVGHSVTHPLNDVTIGHSP